MRRGWLICACKILLEKLDSKKWKSRGEFKVKSSKLKVRRAANKEES
jgi:hypothetical protein